MRDITAQVAFDTEEEEPWRSKITAGDEVDGGFGLECLSLTEEEILHILTGGVLDVGVNRGEYTLLIRRKPK